MDKSSINVPPEEDRTFTVGREAMVDGLEGLSFLRCAYLELQIHDTELGFCRTTVQSGFAQQHQSSVYAELQRVIDLVIIRFDSEDLLTSTNCKV